MRRAVALAITVAWAGCKGNESSGSAAATTATPPSATTHATAEPSAKKEAPPPEAPKPLTAIAVCAKLEAAGAAAKCKEKDAKDGDTFAVFKATVPNAGGVVTVFGDAKHFDGVTAKMAPTAKGKHVAHSTATRTLVTWESSDTALDAKIRAVVERL